MPPKKSVTKKHASVPKVTNFIVRPDGSRWVTSPDGKQNPLPPLHMPNLIASPKKSVTKKRVSSKKAPKANRYTEVRHLLPPLLSHVDDTVPSNTPVKTRKQTKYDLWNEKVDKDFANFMKRMSPQKTSKKQKPCTEEQTRSMKTGRCQAIKKCSPNQFYNTYTNTCVKKSPEGYKRSLVNNRLYKEGSEKYNDLVRHYGDMKFFA